MTYTDQEKTAIITQYQTGQANPGIMRRIRRLRTDDLPLGKDILPSGSGRKTHLHRQRV